LSVIKSKDMQLWDTYNVSKSPTDKDILLKHLDPLIQKQVNKWAGSVPRNALETEAKMLAAKGLDNFNPSKGAGLATHVVNSMAPLSRLVYTNQNTARIPENVMLKLNSYNSAKDHLVTTLGRDPNTDELHQELGWNVNELNRMHNYVRKDLVESVGGLNDAFYDGSGGAEEDLLAAIYCSLLPLEKRLFEHTTGYNGKKLMTSPEIMDELSLSQAQLSYQKSLLTQKINKIQGHR